MFHDFSDRKPQFLSKAAFVNTNLNYGPVFSVFVCIIHGYCGNFAGEHVDRHDGKHIPENRRDQKRVAKTSEF
jgi:hypothetical protein